MAKLQFSSKRVAINKAQTQTIVTVVVASFITIFALTIAYGLWSQGLYLQKVISKQQAADTQLKKNLQAVNQLAASYKGFVNTPQNYIGGNPNGTGQNDGNNAQIILDALPSKYDFPALTASIEKILTQQGASIDSIGGTDDEADQSGNTQSANPQPVEMDFTFSIDKANYQMVQNVIGALNHSIRPMIIDNMDISGGGSNMQLTVSAHTYYQPAKELSVQEEAVQ